MDNTQLPAEVDKRQQQLEDDPGVSIAYIEGFKEAKNLVATEYATKLHHAQQEIESLTNQLKNHSKVADENMKLLRQENEDKDLLIEMYNVKHNKARALIEKMNAKYGALHHEALANEIKQFLDGK